MNLLSADISNWNSPSAENNASCLAQSCTGPPVIRDSLESANLSEIAVAQHDAFESIGRSTMGYAWASTMFSPEVNADATIKLIDGHCSTKRVWLDVEDYLNFLKTHNPYIPQKLLSTLLANGESPTTLSVVSPFPKSSTIDSLKKLTLAPLSTQQAAGWVRAWVNEIRKLGYTPGIYSAPGVWADICGSDTSFSDVDGWGAAWGVGPVTTPPIPWGGITSWCGVQYLAGGADATLCGIPLDLNSWDSDKLGVDIPVPPPLPNPQPGGPYASQADFDRLNAVLVWRLSGIEQAMSQAGFYLDPNNVPPES